MRISEPPVITEARTCARCGKRFGAVGREYSCQACRKPKHRERHPESTELTCRESQIAALVREAKQNKEIAIELGLTYGTIKEHMHRIFRKLHISNRTELALKFAGENNGVSGQ